MPRSQFPRNQIGHTKSTRWGRSMIALRTRSLLHSRLACRLCSDHCRVRFCCIQLCWLGLIRPVIHLICGAHRCYRRQHARCYCACCFARFTLIVVGHAIGVVVVVAVAIVAAAAAIVAIGATIGVDFGGVAVGIIVDAVAAVASRRLQCQSVLVRSVC